MKRTKVCVVESDEAGEDSSKPLLFHLWGKPRTSFTVAENSVSYLSINQPSQHINRSERITVKAIVSFLPSTWDATLPDRNDELEGTTSSTSKDTKSRDDHTTLERSYRASKLVKLGVPSSVTCLLWDNDSKEIAYRGRNALESLRQSRQYEPKEHFLHV